FGEELAKDDVHHYVDSLLENETVSKSLYLAVVEGDLSELLEYEYKDIDDIGLNIYRLLEQNIEQEHMISSTLHEIAHNLYAAGEDLYMPIIRKEEEIVAISGTALFRNGKMVSTISSKDTFYVNLIGNDFKAGTFETIIQKEDIPAGLLKNTANEI